jgi:hypothetical protein
MSALKPSRMTAKGSNHRKGRRPAGRDERHRRRGFPPRHGWQEAEPRRVLVLVIFRLRRQQAAQDSQADKARHHHISDRPPAARCHKQRNEAGYEAARLVAELIERRHQVLVFFRPGHFDPPGVEDDVMRGAKDQDHETDQRHEADILRRIGESQHRQQHGNRSLAKDQPGPPPADADERHAMRRLEQGRPEIFERIPDGDERQDTDRIRVDPFLGQPGRQHANNGAIGNAGREGEDQHRRHAAVFQGPESARRPGGLLHRKRGIAAHAAPAFPAAPVHLIARVRRA